MDTCFREEKIVKVVAIVSLLLLSPILAMEDDFSVNLSFFHDDSLTQLCEDRIQGGEKRIKGLQEEANITTQGKKDVIVSVKEEIHEKRSRLSTHKSFQEELDALLGSLRHPEDLLTIEQRRALIGFPVFKHFQPIITATNLLKNFIEKWQLLISYGKFMQIYANHTIWYHHQWIQFAAKIDDKLTQKKMLREDLVEIYKWMSFFHIQAAQLVGSRKELIFSLQGIEATLPTDLEPLDVMLHALTSFFHVRGSALWEIIRYSNLITDTEEAKGLAENYEDLPINFCLCEDKFVEETLNNPEKDSLEIVTISPPPMRQNHSPSKAYSTRSLPISPQKHSSLLNKGALSSSKTQQSYSAPQSRSDTPLPIRMKKETSKRNVKKNLSDIFVQPNHWESYVNDFKEQVLLLVHAKFIVDPLSDPLCGLLGYYNNFTLSFQQRPEAAYDNLSPKAYLDIPGQFLVRIPQTKARKVCSLKSKGPLCFNQAECDVETILTFSSVIDNLIFNKGREGYLSYTREQIFQFWFDSLFGFSPDPMLVGACGDVPFYEPPSNRKLGFASSYSEKYITNPDGWSENKNLDFITIHKNHKSQILGDLLNQIAIGQGSFKKLLGKISVDAGIRVLSAFVTGEDASPENFVLIKNNKKFNIMRAAGVGDDSIFQPSFTEINDKNHYLIRHNIFYLLLMDEKIPEDVKGEFKSDKMLLGLPFFLTQLTKTQKSFDEFIQKHNLTTADDILGTMGLSKANVLGLTLTAREETIPEILRIQSIITKNLKTPGITYGQIFQKVRPFEYECNRQLLENAKKKVQTTPVFFTEIIPPIIKKLRKIHIISLEELNSFEEASNCYHEKINEYLKEIGEFNDQKAFATSQISNLKGAQTKNDEKILELQQQLTLLTQNTASEISPLPLETTSVTEVSEKQDITFEVKEAGLDSLVENSPIDNSTAIKIEELRKQQRELHQQFQKTTEENATAIEEENERKSTDSLELIKKTTLYQELIESLEERKKNKRKLEDAHETLKNFDLILKNLHIRLLPENLFKELKNSVDEKAQTFFQDQYKWAEEDHMFYVSVVLEAWKKLLDTAEKPIIYETFIKPASESDWTGIPTIINQYAMCDSLIQSTYPIKKMVQDLIHYADISSLSPPTALEFLDRLLTLVPSLEKKPHPSWEGMVSIAKQYFLGMTPHVQSFFQSLGLKPEEEASVLQNAQIQKFEKYERSIKMITSQCSNQQPTPDQLVNDLLHQLWLGSLELNQEDQLFFDGLIRLFTLPLHGSLSPAGLATNLESKGGVFELRYEVSDHYNLISIAEWIKLLHSSRILPAKIRLAFLSQAPHLLLFQWLDFLKEFYPNISFHAWYPQTVSHKITLLQEFLRTHLTPRFNEIMLAVWPELYFVVEEKLRENQNNVDLTLSACMKENPKQIPVENNKVKLDRHNMFSHLDKWEEVYLRCIDSDPLSLDNTATEWLADLKPADYGPKVLARILNVATHFDIDLSLPVTFLKGSIFSQFQEV